MSSQKIDLPLDLSYLYEISDDNREFIYEILLTIVKNIPPMLEEIEATAEKNNWIELGRLMHKLKPSLLLLNIDCVSALIRELEGNAKKERNTDIIPSQVTELTKFCDLILHELNELVDTDRY